MANILVWHFSNIVNWEWIFIALYSLLDYNLNNSIPYIYFIWYILFKDESSVLWNQHFINDNVFSNIVSWEWIFIAHVYSLLEYLNNLNNSISYLCFIWYILYDIYIEDEFFVLWNQRFINDNVFSKYEYFLILSLRFVEKYFSKPIITYNGYIISRMKYCSIII